MNETLLSTTQETCLSFSPQFSGVVELDEEALRQVVGGRCPSETCLLAGPHDGW